MEKREVISLVIRYGILLLIGLANLFLADKGLFYTIFTPLTVYPSYYVFNYLYDAILISSNVIFFKGYYAQIIPACIAGSAYYLLLILNMTTPMKIGKRFASIIFLMITFLVLNVLRIVFFGTLLFKGYQYFDIAHVYTWYFGSTLLVVLIWFVNVFAFKIRAIPLYGDIKPLFTELIKR